MQPIAQRFAKRQLFISETQTAVVLNKLKNEDIDAGILALPIEDNGLQTQTLYHEHLLLAISHQHQLATQATVTSDSIANKTILLLEDDHCLGGQAFTLLIVALLAKQTTTPSR